MFPHAFLDRPRTPARTSAGRIELPVIAGAASAIFALFRVEHRAAAAALQAAPVAPARFAGDTAIVAVAAHDYRETSLGPYREVGVALAVLPRQAPPRTLSLARLLRAPPRERVGWHFLDSAVTTAIAEVAGREVWGFPRFTTEIDVEVGEHEVSAIVQAPTGEEPILVLEGSAGMGLTLQARDLALYTVRGGELHRVVAEARGGMHTGRGRGLALRVGTLDHPMAFRLAALGLDGARPVAAQLCRHYHSVLHAGLPVHAVRARAA